MKCLLKHRESASEIEGWERLHFLESLGKPLQAGGIPQEARSNMVCAVREELCYQKCRVGSGSDVQ